MWGDASNDLHQLYVRFGNSLFWHVCAAWFGLQLLTILVLGEEMPRYSLLSAQVFALQLVSSYRTALTAPSLCPLAQ